MPQDRLTEYLQERAGEYLRGVVQYDRESFEIVYIRDGLDRESFTQRVERFHDNLRHHRLEETGDDSFGKPYATLSVRERAVVLNLRWSSTEGILVGLEPGAARNLVEFIHESMERGLPDGPPT